MKRTSFLASVGALTVIPLLAPKKLLAAGKLKAVNQVEHVPFGHVAIMSMSGEEIAHLPMYPGFDADGNQCFVATYNATRLQIIGPVRASSEQYGIVERTFTKPITLHNGDSLQLNWRFNLKPKRT